MKRMLTRLLGALGVAAAMMWSSVATVTVWGGAASLMAWSPSASAQSVDCSAGYYCTYGPFCVDAWGGCFYYSWWVGSAVNTWSEGRGGISDVIKLCTDPNIPDPSKCVFLTSNVTLTTGNGPNVAIQCSVPGSDTCTGKGCGGSPNSSGGPFILKGIYLSTGVTSPVDSKGCVKQGGSIKCTKTNTVPILENNAAAAAEYCPNPGWVISRAIPLQFSGETIATGPLSKQDPTPWASKVTATCVLRDPQGRYPNDPNYQLSTTLTKNFMECTPTSGVTSTIAQ